ECYPGQGYQVDSVTPRDWSAGGRAVPGKEYVFSKSFGAVRIAVENFMVLPDGQIGRDMDSVTRSAKDRRKKYFGAAQVQLLFAVSTPRAERDATVAAFVRALGGAIAANDSGVKPRA